ncbi:hypothetical protein SB759_33255, partial [Pseudomonas sp. SIMBA_059]
MAPRTFIRALHSPDDINVTPTDIPVKDKKSSSHAGSNRLKGMGDIKSRAQFGISGSYDVGPVVLGATLE